jgi:hypothetical protein
VEIIPSLNNESFKLSNTNKSNSINIIKFCDDFRELTELAFSDSPNELNQDLADINNQDNNANIESNNSFNVIFLLKNENLCINLSQNSNKNDLVRNSIKQNINLKNSWYTTIFYVS